MNTCSNHPDRPAHIQCQRCDRPVCPQCQQQAAVGFHCPQCVQEARRRRPASHTQFGAPVRADQRPLVTWTVIGLCVVLYALQILPQYLGAAGARLPDPTQYFFYAPLHTSEHPLYPVELWRMLTSALVHSPSNAAHLLFNMVALWFIGRVLEPAIGRWRYIALLVLSALGGSVAVMYLSDPTVPTLGASGAVFGLFGALFVLLRASGGQSGGVIVLVGINMLISFTVPNISWQGHLGGLVVGLLCALVIAKVPRGKNRSLLQGLGLGAVFLALVALIAVGIPLVNIYGS